MDLVVGLAEVMDTEAVASGEAEIHEKISAAKRRGLTIDGHIPRVSGDRLQKVARYLDTDHESIGFEEAKEKVEAGLYVHVREGSSSKNLESLEPLLEVVDSRRLTFCTDNLYPGDLEEHGGIGPLISRLIDEGYDPVEVIQMATINTAECYDLDVGRVAPGAPADLVLLDDLESWDVDHVVVDGEVDPSADWTGDPPSSITVDSVTIPPISAEELAHPAPGNRSSTVEVRVIDHRDGNGGKMTHAVPVKDGVLCAGVAADVLPVAVVARHGNDVVGGTAVVHDDTIAHDYLRASNPDYWDLRVNNLLCYEMLMKMRQRGLDRFDFQGGRPGVFKFKKGFSTEGRGNFYIAKQTHMPDVYQRLTEAAATHGVDTDTGYFPAYREEQSN